MRELLPHSIEAEESVLGAMLITPNAIETVAPHLASADFYRGVHGHIYGAITALHDEGFRADPVTVADRLATQGVLDQCGGSARLLDLQAGTPSTTNVAHYALIVRDHAARRNALARLAETDSAIRGGADAHAAVGELVETFTASSSATSTWDPVDIDALWDGSADDAFPPAILGERVDGAKCISPGAKGLLLAPPESGKSFLAIAMCVDSALMGRPAIYVDFESRANRVVARLRQHIHGNRCRGFFTYVRPNAAIAPSDRWKARRRLDSTRPALVVIDGYNALLAKHKLDANKTTDIAALAEAVIEPWSRDDVCTLLIDHVAKDDTRMGRTATTAIGSISKTGLVDYALALEPDRDRRIAKGTTGSSHITVAKDRDGELRHHCADQHAFGAFTVRSSRIGRWQHQIFMPPGQDGPATAWEA